jgi:glycosyltransferase involved in cell wall biosynthesis
VAIPVVSATSYGADAYVRALLPALERYGNRADFLILVAENHLPPLRGDANVQVVPIEAPRWGGRYARVLWEQRALPRLLDGLDVDVVYTAANVGLLRGGPPCVIAVRNMDPLVPKFGRESLRLRVNSWVRRALSRASIRASTRIVAVSRYVKDYLVAHGTPPDKIDVIYHGIDDLDGAAAAASPPAGAPPYAAAASKFIRYANLTVLVEAFARMRALGFAGPLRVAGGPLDPVYEREVRGRVRGLGLVRDVEFLGYVSRERVQELLRGCAVFLHPSRLEACPFILLEAMRQGAPIVTTTAGPMREICEDAALYASPDDAAGFGEAACRLASSPDLRADLQDRARRRAADFRWEDSVRRLVATLERAACA